MEDIWIIVGCKSIHWNQRELIELIRKGIKLHSNVASCWRRILTREGYKWRLRACLLKSKWNTLNSIWIVTNKCNSKNLKDIGKESLSMSLHNLTISERHKFWTCPLFIHGLHLRITISIKCKTFFIDSIIIHMISRLRREKIRLNSSLISTKDPQTLTEISQFSYLKVWHLVMFLTIKGCI